MPYRLALFDFDGTLADTFPWFLRVINEVADRFDFRRIEPGDVESLRHLDTRALLRHLGVRPGKVPAIALHMRALAARDAKQLAPFPGVREALARLDAAGVTLGVVTSNSTGNVRHILGEASFDRFRHVDCGASLYGKPRRLRRVLAAAGVTPASAIYVGDEQRDAEAARAAGMHFGAVLWGFASPASLQALRPAATFASPADLVTLG